MDKEYVVHIHNGILLSHKKNEIMPFAATWMDLEIIILNEVSQTEKDKYHMISLSIIIYRITQIIHKKQTYGYQGERGGKGDNLGGWN